ncbi:hypothetical protein RCL_jg24613.t1 [Rhizophagus clarus]|uniref:Uncharacterized protein n=1 Tax=Rhizophagus clarus TaxID=94130 RepID=A0A8H3MGD5_9GLOM|nr:hypothetical protein RCL_jg24613.t1 [Rhizophagus clarus]
MCSIPPIFYNSYICTTVLTPNFFVFIIQFLDIFFFFPSFLPTRSNFSIWSKIRVVILVIISASKKS